MSTGFDQAFQKVKQLMADFRANEKFHLSPEYQEQEARHDFIDTVFAQIWANEKTRFCIKKMGKFAMQ
jgi:hypothetical protein